MNRSILLGLGAAAGLSVSVAQADDRWYLTSSLGLLIADDSEFNVGPYADLGVGKGVSDWLSVEAKTYWSSLDTDRRHGGRHYEKWGLTADALIHPFNWSGLRPFAKVGLTGQHVRFGDAKTFAPGVEAGLGAMWNPSFMPVGLRADLTYQLDIHRNNQVATDDNFYEWILGVGVVVPLGSQTAAAPPPPPPPPVVAPAPAPGPAPTLAPVTFPLDSSVLTTSAKATLDSVAEVLNANPDMSVDVVGHADDTGPAGYNLQLSERRAKSVKNYLIAQGVDASRMTVRAVGEDQPRADNSSNEGRALNRRVEFDI